MASSMVPCPVCLNGSGQITGPESIMADMAAEDVWYGEIRVCDECEGAGILPAARAAGILAESMQKVLPIVDRVMQERDPRYLGAVESEAKAWAEELGLR